ncbi:ribosomal RNA processing protein 1-like B isoform X2 [Spatholobus suberectus]|nr:ribosomal RNA processing protein 1-like B isoform X2 [Spatholobus suberectus]
MRRNWFGIDVLRVQQVLPSHLKVHFLLLKPQVLEVLLRSFISAMGGKIRSSLFDVLLRMGKRLLEVKKGGDKVDSRDDVVVLGTVTLVMGFSRGFYEVGSSTDCYQGNRKVLFGLPSKYPHRLNPPTGPPLLLDAFNTIYHHQRLVAPLFQRWTQKVSPSFFFSHAEPKKKEDDGVLSTFTVIAASSPCWR